MSIEKYAESLKPLNYNDIIKMIRQAYDLQYTMQSSKGMTLKNF